MRPTPETARQDRDRGRGAISNPSGRFERLALVSEPVDDIDDDDDRPRRPTELFRDSSKSILSTNESPDVGMDVYVNPYRGCEHGCIYCYARPYHEYLGLSAGLDFESKIFVKEDAPALLREALTARSWKPRPIGFSGVTDCYQPIERRLKLPCKQVSSVAFGGDDLKDLYITSASKPFVTDLMPPGYDPKGGNVGGSLYRTRVNTQGRPEHLAGLL